MRPLEASRWQIALGAPQLPQAIEIVSRSNTEYIQGNQAELRRPALLASGTAIPVEVSLWSFAQATTATRRLIYAADEVTAVDQAALRLDRLVSIAEAAQSAAAELTPPDGYNWFQSWAMLLNAARAQTQQLAGPNVDSAKSQISRTSEEQISQAVQRLENWLAIGRKTMPGPDSGDSPAPRAATDAAVSSRFIAAAAGVWSYYVAEGGSDRLVLQLRPATLSLAQIRWVGVLLVAAATALAIWLMRWPAVADFACRWPHALGILFGVAYWAWLWPSWLGILLSAASLWLALRFDWPGRSLRTEASTVLRASRST
jgi:hypothetical protein